MQASLLCLQMNASTQDQQDLTQTHPHEDALKGQLDADSRVHIGTDDNIFNSVCMLFKR